ncbi:bifunctional DNA-binding transcriptional regulator/O6-methylguanine-DNA methyltransferase Ada [Sandaracinobacteroides saxicola]|uniref:methylated-DNA--[protein]-cysteine S-methyltransferase n=1 Tax=Sandaracinobacteroides saxicola TaxID=2759707 RepID=A0A7G5IIV2_9SPHN|nr:bifunctional DNA-binding transcriptional regulator/O6-methylguanine-DNA methyltransferase Ada [Sandaracinobacteroides saxicola]QMW23294.1 bifunctional DNA-binding transcriptional regulator/O6-methylguanine-DNA methyltransferase Ada [Sandaracinobacteroides saxicola]
MDKDIDAARWARVQAHDKTADGEFFYAVRTTGVFCRPSCPARTAKRANVIFYETAAGAEAAGYRPCRRCHPLAMEGRDPHGSLMQAMASFIVAHADERLSLERLAQEAGMSPFHFQRSFKAVIGVSPKDYQAAERLRRFKDRLRAGDTVLGATFEAGYGSTSRIYERVGDNLGMTPSAYRAGGAGERIVHAARETALGPLMMAATERGICFVQFGTCADALARQLAQEFPRAQLEPAAAGGSAELDAWMVALGDHLAGVAPRPDLPLDLRGTAFQISVWRLLMSVREGEVVSYSELAAGVGAPRAVRAAASACAANRVAVLIPCHRALRADGGLGGYRWGLERKRALLDAERAHRVAA